MQTMGFRAALVALLSMAGAANAQLEITEIMYNPGSGGDSVYEWFEVRNIGTEAIDLDGAQVERLNDTYRTTFSPSIQATNNPQGTTLAPGAVGVIYDGFVNNGNRIFNFDADAFRTTWSIPNTVPVFGVDFFPDLTNSGNNTNFGIWLADDTPGEAGNSRIMTDANDRVTSYDGSIVNIDYDITAPWPAAAQNGFSIEWNGTGDFKNGAGWAESVDGVNGARTSIALIDPNGLANSTDDFGSPGQIQNLGTPASGLLFTEIMYNPRSSDTAWEWVEVYNNTGAAIDFGATPYVFQDDDGDNLAAANVTSGSIPQGGVAVLFDGDENNAADMATAWGAGVNFIPVSSFPGLSNGGDSIGVWSSLADYTTDSGETRTFDNALTSLTYDNDDFDWPNDGGFNSVYLKDLTNAGATVTIPAEGDFNGDGSVDAADYTLWRDGDLAADTNSDGMVDETDYAVWASNYGAETVETAGSFWALAGTPFGDPILDLDFDSRNAMGVASGAGTEFYPAGDVASPGVFSPGGAPGLAVPEPSAIAMASLALLGLVRRRG